MIFVCLIFFCLSFILAKIVLRFPADRCQMSWSIVAVWGIANVVSAVFLYAIWFVPDVSINWLYRSLWLVFLSALPGMLYLNWQQVKIWRGMLRERDKEIMILKSQLELEKIVNQKLVTRKRV